ncbi:MAG: CRISPR-associated endonuclease Cas1 [Thermoleophilaceae bacterium]
MSGAGSAVPDLVPARMLNEHVYCPRLAYLEWVNQGFQDSADTVEGRFVHRRVDQPRGRPAHVDGEDERPPSTSVTVGSERLGLIAKIDLIESDGKTVVPVEYKRGRPRDGDPPLWEPELVQLCAQVLLLRDEGYTVERAEAYFSETRTRHPIAISDDLVARTRVAIAELRTTATQDEAPPPLVDSPKCPRCSLVSICLPDEVNTLRGAREQAPRRLVASDSAATPLYASTPGSRLSKRGGRVVLLEDREEKASRRLIDVSHVSVFGNVTVGSAVLRACFEAGTPVLWFTAGGWFSGVATGMPSKNIQVRVRQHRASAVGSPELAGAFVSGKIRNARTLVRRHSDGNAAPALAQLAALARQAGSERRLESLLGIEGTAARIYFQQLAKLLSGPFGGFDFDGRNRRPPRDRVNAMLSFVYALLLKDAVVAVLAAGLEPYLGLYHRPGFGRPALALDLAEEFRPLVGDSVVLTAINNGEVGPDDFVERAGAVALTQGGRRSLIRTYERRMATELVHPLFKYRASYRRSLEIQARLLAAVLVGDIPSYRPLTTR